MRACQLMRWLSCPPRSFPYAQDPDDAFSKVPYEKGFAFLVFLEAAVGGAAAFDPFLKARDSARAFVFSARFRR